VIIRTKAWLISVKKKPDSTEVIFVYLQSIISVLAPILYQNHDQTEQKEMISSGEKIEAWFEEELNKIKKKHFSELKAEGFSPLIKLNYSELELWVNNIFTRDIQPYLPRNSPVRPGFTLPRPPPALQ